MNSAAGRSFKPNLFAAVQVGKGEMWAEHEQRMFQVDAPEILAKMHQFQSACLEREPRLENFLVPVTKAHITLLVMEVPEHQLGTRQTLSYCCSECGFSHLSGKT